MSNLWKFDYKKSGEPLQMGLEAYWEVDGHPISDDYTPEDISADELFEKWVQSRAGQDDLVSIYWQVRLSDRKAEHMPFQYQDFHEDFLTFYSRPINAQSEEPLNWLSLPVMDKLWSIEPYRADKGGFIQSATGWKPSILQPFVSLRSLTRTRSPF